MAPRENAGSRIWCSSISATPSCSDHSRSSQPMSFLALLLATATSASTPTAAQSTGQPAPPSEGDPKEAEEHKEEAPPKPAAPGGTGATPASSAPAAGTATATPAAQGAAPSPSANPRAQTLVSGAPLYNPNVAVHIVERKPFADQGKHEITLFPALAQVNGKFTQHFGTALSYAYHVHENFGFQLMPQWNWFNTESSFNKELIDKGRVEAQAATSLLLNWGAVGGVEVVPLYGKFAWYENNLLQYSVVLNGAAGYGTTRHELKPRTPTSGATYGD